MDRALRFGFMAAGASAAATSTHAAMVTWDPADLALTVTETLSIDVAGQEASLGTAPGGTIFQFNLEDAFLANKPTADTLGGTSLLSHDSTDAAALGKLFAGDEISFSANTPDLETSPPSIPWGGSLSTAYVGFSFVPDTTTLYGWMEFTYDPGSDIDEETFTFHRLAYDDSGLGVIAGGGAVPEPTSVTLVMAALAGSAALYRRRRA